MGGPGRYRAGMDDRDDSARCLICAKHRGEGPLVGPIVWADDLLVVTHGVPGAEGSAVLGYLFVEPRRHVPYLPDLTEEEAEAIARIVRRAAIGLRAELHPDFVFSAVVGTGVSHFHQHLFVRPAGTPARFGWMEGDKWPDAPRGTLDDIVELCGRLRPYIERS